MFSERDETLVDLHVDLVDHAGEVIDVVEVHAQQQRVVPVEAALQRQAQLADPGTHPGQSHIGHHLDVALAGHERIEHPSRRFAHHIRHHRVELDASILEQLLDPLGLPPPILDQLRAIASEVAQPGDLRWRHEAARSSPHSNS